MAFNDGFYYEDKDDVQFDKDILISYWSKGWWGYNLASPQYLASKGYKFLNTNGDWYYVIGNHKQDEAYPLSKAVENSGKVPFNQLASTKYPEVDLPTVGSMLAIWADKPSAEYKEEEIFELMTAFADHNKDYFRANYNALREEIAQIPENLEGYSKESLEALNTAKTALNYNLNRNKQAELDTLVANLKAARLGLKPAATHSGSLDENEVAANVETRPELITRTEEIPFEVINKENPNLPAGQQNIITAGVKGERTHYISVLTENGKTTETVLDSQVTKEAVNQVVEVGAPVTHKGDESGLAPTTEVKPRLDVQEEEIPFTTVTRENPLLLKGKTQVITKGVNGHRSNFYSVSTSADGKEVKTLVNSVVAQEAVTQIVEIGTLVTHKGDESGLAPTTEVKPRLDIQDEEIPFTTVTRENPLLLKGKTQVITKGVNGHRSNFYSVSTVDGKEVKTLVSSVVAQEAVTQIVEVGTLVTHVGDEHDLAPVAETKPRLDIQEAEIPFTTVTRENPLLLKGKTQVITKGVNGHRSNFYSVSTVDGKEVKTLVSSVVAQETVTQIVEVGTMITHVGDENGQAAIAEEKPKLEIPSQPAPATAPAEENKALPQGPAPVATEKKLPETGSHDSAGLVVAGLMATLAAYGLTKRKED